MTYFLDFDRTIFDFDSFYPYLVNIPALAHLRERLIAISEIPRGINEAHDQKRNALWDELHTLYGSDGFEFHEDELAKYVFPDARDFLKKQGQNTVIVTKGGVKLAFQKGKVTSSGVLSFVQHCEYVERGTPKGEILKKLCTQYPGPYIFVDDFSKELESAQELCPDIQLFEIRRDGRDGSGAFSVIRSLAELA